MKIIRQLGEAGIPIRLKRLTDGISRDILARYSESGFEAEPSLLPILLILKENSLCSVQEIASSLGFSHPAAVQFVQKMENKKLLRHSPDKSDKRKKMISLTSHGYDIIEKIA